MDNKTYNLLNDLARRNRIIFGGEDGNHILLAPMVTFEVINYAGEYEERAVDVLELDGRSIESYINDLKDRITFFQSRYDAPDEYYDVYSEEDSEVIYEFSEPTDDEWLRITKSELLRYLSSVINKLTGFMVDIEEASYAGKLSDSLKSSKDMKRVKDNTPLMYKDNEQIEDMIFEKVSSLNMNDFDDRYYFHKASSEIGLNTQALDKGMSELGYSFVRETQPMGYDLCRIYQKDNIQTYVFLNLISGVDERGKNLKNIYKLVCANSYYINGVSDSRKIKDMKTLTLEQERELVGKAYNIAVRKLEQIQSGIYTEDDLDDYTIEELKLLIDQFPYGISAQKDLLYLCIELGWIKEDMVSDSRKNNKDMKRVRDMQMDMGDIYTYDVWDGDDCIVKNPSPYSSLEQAKEAAREYLLENFVPTDRSKDDGFQMALVYNGNETISSGSFDNSYVIASWNKHNNSIAEFNFPKWLRKFAKNPNENLSKWYYDVDKYTDVMDSRKIKDADETQDVLDGILMIAFNDGSEEDGYNEVKKHANEQGELDGVQYETYDTDNQDGVTLIDLCAATDDANAFVKALLTEWGIIDAVADIEFEKSELMENAEVSDSRKIKDSKEDELNDFIQIIYDAAKDHNLKVRGKQYWDDNTLEIEFGEDYLFKPNNAKIKIKQGSFQEMKTDLFSQISKWLSRHTKREAFANRIRDMYNGLVYRLNNYVSDSHKINDNFFDDNYGYTNDNEEGVEYNYAVFDFDECEMKDFQYESDAIDFCERNPYAASVMGYDGETIWIKGKGRVSDSKVEDMTKPAHLRGYAEKYRKKRREQKESYKENEEETQDKEVTDSRRIKDSDDEYLLQEIANQLEEGYRSGYDPQWDIDITVDGADISEFNDDDKDLIYQDIAYVVKDGYDNYMGIETELSDGSIVYVDFVLNY